MNYIGKNQKYSFTIVGMCPVRVLHLVNDRPRFGISLGRTHLQHYEADR